MLAMNELIAFLTRNQFLSPSQGEALARERQRFASAIQLCGELVQRGWVTPYQQSQLLSGHGEKLVVGSYRIQVPIGEGGMGIVFKAVQPKLDRIVALKIIRPQVLAARPEILSRFHREARAIAQLNHPNIVLLFDADEANGTHYIAMEYVEGLTLEKMVRTQGPLSIRQACEYMRQSALGLQHACEVGLVHRDIKPSNILVAQKATAGSNTSSMRLSRPQLVTLRDRERQAQVGSDGRPNQGWGQVKILDMGLARLVEGIDDDKPPTEYTPLTRAGALLGTPDFIAPEQARDARTVDIRADIYSLGCTFYYVLTGKAPFPGGSDVQKLIRHQSEKPFPIEDLRPGVPSDVARILGRMLEKRPDDRYTTPQQLADALAAVLVLGTADPAAPATPVAETPAVAETPRPMVEPRLPARETELTDEIPAFPVFAGDEMGVTRVIAQAARTPPSSVILGAHTGLVGGVAVSPDGARVVTAGIDGRLRLWDVSSPNPREIASVPRPGVQFQAIAFAPHDDYVVAGGTHQGTARVWRWDWRDGNLAEWGAYRGEQVGVPSVAFSPDGKRFAAAIGPFAVVWKVYGRRARSGDVLKGHGRPVRAVAFSPDGRRLAAAGEGKHILVWKLGWLGASLKAKFEGHPDIVTAIAFSHNGRRLATAGLDRAVVLWDALNPQTRTSIPLFGHTSHPRLVQFLADGRTLASVSEGGQVLLWDVAAGAKVDEFLPDTPLAPVLALTPNGRRLITGSTDGRVTAFDLGHPAAVTVG